MTNPLIKLKAFKGKVKRIIDNYSSLFFPEDYYWNNKTISLIRKFQEYLEQKEHCKYIGSGACSDVFRINRDWVIKLSQPEPSEEIDFEAYNLGYEYYEFAKVKNKIFDPAIFEELRKDTEKCIVPLSYISKNYKMAIQRYVVERPGYKEYCKAMETKYNVFITAKAQYMLPFVYKDFINGKYCYLHNGNTIFDGEYPKLIDLF